jgi:hypothetical protein
VACAWHPCNWSNYVGIVLSIKDLLNISSNGIPKVYSLSKTHSKYVIRAPIEQVKIVIVDNVGCIEYLLGELRDASDCLLLLLRFLLRQSLYERDILMKGHRRARSLLFERENSLVWAIFLLLLPFFTVRYPRKTQLFILRLLESQGVGRATLRSEHTLSHELLETLLLLVTRSQRVLSRRGIRRTTILNSISSPLSLIPFGTVTHRLTVNCASIQVVSSGRIGLWRRTVGRLI